MIEQWEDIPGYEAHYKISNKGRVKSLKRKHKSRNQFCEFERTVREKILRSQVGGTGYMKVSLSKNGILKNKNIHRMIAEAFIPNPDGLEQVNHKDCDKKNNCISNLEWCTPEQNSRHAHKLLDLVNPYQGVYGAQHPASKSIVQKTKDGKIINRWGSGMDAVRLGFDSSCISRCCKGESAHHKGYIWEYA